MPTTDTQSSHSTPPLQPDSNHTLERLSRPFEPSKVKTREQAGQQVQYIAIALVQDRLDEVLGFHWTLDLDQEHLDEAEPNQKGQPQWDARCRATITVDIDGVVSTRQGFGAARGTSIENVLKSAQADATKKAAVQYGIGRELWYSARRVFVTAAPHLISLAHAMLDECEDVEFHEAEKRLKGALKGAVQGWLRKDASVPRPKEDDHEALSSLVQSFLAQAGARLASSTAQDLARAALLAAGEDGR